MINAPKHWLGLLVQAALVYQRSPDESSLRYLMEQAREIPESKLLQILEACNDREVILVMNDNPVSSRRPLSPVSSADLLVSTFCNYAHRLDNGAPILHECRKIPPLALQAEKIGDFNRANDILAQDSTQGYWIYKGNYNGTRNYKLRRIAPCYSGLAKTPDAIASQST